MLHVNSNSAFIYSLIVEYASYHIISCDDNQVRDFEYNSETQDSRKEEVEKLAHDQESMRSSLLQWCYSSYGEVTLL